MSNELAGRVTGSTEGPIGWVTFDNPKKHNAMSYEMWCDLADVMTAHGADPAIRVVVLRGAGDHAFISGADISQFGERRASNAANIDYSAAAGTAFDAVRNAEKPTVAMIRGYCIGGGLAVALCCDLRIAAAGSQFAIPAARLGLGYAFESVRRLTEIVGPAFAKEILFAARRYDADEALAMGIVNRVLPSEALDDETRNLAEAIAGNAPLTVAAAKRAVDAVLRDPAERNLDAVQASIERCFDSEDFAEGRRAFAEKRKPQFKGR